jgi:hypothetical protein
MKKVGNIWKIWVRFAKALLVVGLSGQKSGPESWFVPPRVVVSRPSYILLSRSERWIALLGTAAVYVNEKHFN